MPTVPATQTELGSLIRAPRQTAAALAVVAVAVIWGVSFTVVKDTLAHVPSPALVAWRFLIAAALLAVARPQALRVITRQTFGRGVVLGSILGLGFLLCTYGLETTPVVVSAFVTGMTVVFAPLVAWGWLRRRLDARFGLSVLLGLVGLALITLRGVAVEAGTLLVLAGAAAWAVHLVALERWTVASQVWASTVVQVASAGTMAAVVLSLQGERLAVPDDGSAVLGLVFLGAAATGAACWLLTWAQSRLDATTAAVLLTLEPVVAVLTAALLGEALSAVVLAGALLVVTAAVLVSTRR